MNSHPIEHQSNEIWLKQKSQDPIQCNYYIKVKIPFCFTWEICTPRINTTFFLLSLTTHAEHRDMRDWSMQNDTTIFMLLFVLLPTILCLISRTTMTSLSMSKHCKTHHVCVYTGISFWTHEKMCICYNSRAFPLKHAETSWSF